jgi:uncharacterized protein YcnI
VPIPRTLRSAGRWLAVAAVAALLGGGGAAYAHVQVLPATVAPFDAVQFTVLVPGESDAKTVKVELQIPDGLLPFAWSDPPRWKRSFEEGDTQLGTVVWEGELPVDGFVEFSFLAGTPEEPGEIVWRALQTYDDGTVVRWIGPPDSEEPAAVTVVSEDAPRQNAGGETGGSVQEEAGDGETGGETETGETETPAAPTETVAAEPAATSSDGGGPDWIARGLGFLAILTAVAGFTLGRRTA